MIVLFDILQGIDPKQALFIIVNLIIIESLLSIDTAILIGGMVSLCPQEKQSRYFWTSIVSMFVLRGFVLLIADWMLNIWWLVPLLGVFLLIFGILIWRNKEVYLPLLYFIFVLWIYELKDQIGMDSVFAAVAFTSNIYLIYFGVFIGIGVVIVISKFIYKRILNWKFIKVSLAIFFMLQGLDLLLKGASHFYTGSELFYKIINSEAFDLAKSLFYLAAFVILFWINRRSNTTTRDSHLL